MLQPDGTATPVGRRLYLAQVVLNYPHAVSWCKILQANLTARRKLRYLRHRLLWKRYL